MSKLDRFRDSEQLSIEDLLAEAAQSTGNNNRNRIKLNTCYMGFRVGTNPAEARQRFVQRYGCEPEVVQAVPGVLLAGPIPSAE